MPATIPSVLKAKVVEWDRAKGYGFLLVNNRRLFLHRRDFVHSHRAPVVGDTVRFIVGKDAEGRPCAREAVLLQRGLGMSGVSLLVLLVLMVLPVMAALRQGAAPQWIATFVVFMGGFTYWANARDKRLAQGGEWRLSEANLHLLEILGGWPGAFLAQRRLRHKCSKASYQSFFWLVVLAYQAMALDLMRDHSYSRAALSRVGMFWRDPQVRTSPSLKPEEKAVAAAEELKQIMLDASEGNVQAQGDLARVYLEGRLARQDLVAAYMWGSLAAHNPRIHLGAGIGQVVRDAAVMKMTTNQVAEGNRLVAAFIPKSVSSPKPAAKALPRGLKLKGISGTPSSRFALVNNRTLARGETAVVNLADRSVSVLCVEIRESSVLINVDDAPTTYELKMN
jgi:uncharacterized membrane protein YsdA (DUF1294 family)/cold shock CspA family protein